MKKISLILIVLISFVACSCEKTTGEVKKLQLGETACQVWEIRDNRGKLFELRVTFKTGTDEFGKTLVVDPSGTVRMSGPVNLSTKQMAQILKVMEAYDTSVK